MGLSTPQTEGLGEQGQTGRGRTFEYRTAARVLGSQNRDGPRLSSGMKKSLVRVNGTW